MTGINWFAQILVSATLASCAGVTWAQNLLSLLLLGLLRTLSGCVLTSLILFGASKSQHLKNTRSYPTSEEHQIKNGRPAQTKNTGAQLKEAQIWFAARVLMLWETVCFEEPNATSCVSPPRVPDIHIYATGRRWGKKRQVIQSCVRLWSSLSIIMCALPLSLVWLEHILQRELCLENAALAVFL